MGQRHGEMGWRCGRLGKMEHKSETNPEQGRDGGLGEMGLDDKGERKKNEKDKGGKKISWRERKRKKR